MVLIYIAIGLAGIAIVLAVALGGLVLMQMGRKLPDPQELILRGNLGKALEPHLGPYAMQDDIPSAPDLSGYARVDEVKPSIEKGLSLIWKEGTEKGKFLELIRQAVGEQGAGLLGDFFFDKETGWKLFRHFFLEGEGRALIAHFLQSTEGQALLLELQKQANPLPAPPTQPPQAPLPPPLPPPKTSGSPPPISDAALKEVRDKQEKLTAAVRAVQKLAAMNASAIQEDRKLPIEDKLVEAEDGIVRLTGMRDKLRHQLTAGCGALEHQRQVTERAVNELPQSQKAVTP
jgi:hypothetical protein